MMFSRWIDSHLVDSDIRIIRKLKFFVDILILKLKRFEFFQWDMNLNNEIKIFLKLQTTADRLGWWHEWIQPTIGCWDKEMMYVVINVPEHQQMKNNVFCEKYSEKKLLHRERSEKSMAGENRGWEGLKGDGF